MSAAQNRVNNNNKKETTFYFKKMKMLDMVEFQ